MSAWSPEEMETAELCLRLVYVSVYEDSGYLGLKACLFVCSPFCPSSTMFPALDGLHPSAPLGQTRLKPPVTCVHWSDASTPSAGS